VRPSRRARIGVHEVLAEESRTRARGARDAPPAPTNGAPSGDARFALIRLVAVLLGAGRGRWAARRWTIDQRAWPLAWPPGSRFPRSLSKRCGRAVRGAIPDPSASTFPVAQTTPPVAKPLRKLNQSALNAMRPPQVHEN